jgi:hypothetical protein
VRKPGRNYDRKTARGYAWGGEIGSVVRGLCSRCQDTNVVVMFHALAFRLSNDLPVSRSVSSTALFCGVVERAVVAPRNARRDTQLKGTVVIDRCVTLFMSS